MTSPDTAAVAERLHALAIHLLRRLRTVDTQSGISGPRLSALSVVVFGGPITLGQLAAAEQVRPPSMTRLVQGLERDGYVRRLGDAHDARLVRIEATARGRRVLLAGRDRRVAMLTGLLAQLEPAEQRTVHRAVCALEALMASAPPAGPAGRRAAT